MNNFIEVNEKMVARSYCCVIASGRTLNAGGGSNAWVDDAYTGRAIRPVATNIKIAPIK